MRLKHQQASQVQPNKFPSRKHDVTAFLADIAPAIVATVLILYALVALVSVSIAPDNGSAPVLSNEERISDVGLRFTISNH